MHRDKKVGLALGILLIGTVGAFFFRNDAGTELVVPTLDDPAQVDQMVDEIDRPRPYPSSDTVTLQRTGGDPADPHEPQVGMPAIDIEVSNDAWVEPSDPSIASEDSFPTGPPDPISINREQFELDLDSRPIPRQDPNASWSTLPASTDRDVSDEPAATDRETSFRPQNPREYEVRPGDTLSGIAQRYLGSSRKYLKIYEINRDRMRSPNDLTIGLKLRIPTKSGTSNSEPREPMANERGSDSRTRVIPSSAVNPSPTPLDSIVDRPRDRPSLFEGSDGIIPSFDNTPDESAPAVRPSSESSPGSRFVPFRRSPLKPQASTGNSGASVFEGTDRGFKADLDENQFPTRSGREETQRPNPANPLRQDPNPGWDSVHQKSPADLIESLSAQDASRDDTREPSRQPSLEEDLIANSSGRLVSHRREAPGGSTISSRGGNGSSTGTRYIVRSGDSLERIALKFYGDRSAVRRIRDANPDTDADFTALRPGMKLILP